VAGFEIDVVDVDGDADLKAGEEDDGNESEE
jgi:hypothetical protein